MPDGIDIPTYAPVNWGAIAPIVQLRRQLAQEEEANKIAAIRYQGQREFEEAMRGGAAPEQALRTAAPKMFYGDPRSMFGAIKSTMPPQDRFGAVEKEEVLPGVFAISRKGAPGIHIARSDADEKKMTEAQKASAAGRAASLQLQIAKGVGRGELEPDSPAYKQLTNATARLYDIAQSGPTKAAAKTEEYPVAPKLPADRKPGTVYLTPKGPYRWTKEGWDNP